LKIELGGGVKPRGDGWINVDQTPNADVKHDLDVAPWPFADDSVDAVYSCHCLEHLRGPYVAFREICRVCKVDAPVEIRVPHPGAHLAMQWGHLYAFSPQEAVNMDRHFPAEYWHAPKRLKLLDYRLEPSELMEQARRELPFLRNLADQIVMKYFPVTCHETRFYYKVIANEFYAAQ
jgi:ubiquinone/menaquinone biosynthesis C-methylase UbiE